jgi:hypothetical protein
MRKVLQQIVIRILCSGRILFEKFAVYELTWKNFGGVG